MPDVHISPAQRRTLGYTLRAFGRLLIGMGYCLIALADNLFDTTHKDDPMPTTAAQLAASLQPIEKMLTDRDAVIARVQPLQAENEALKKEVADFSAAAEGFVALANANAPQAAPPDATAPAAPVTTFEVPING